MSRRTRKNIGVIGLGIIGSRVRDVLRRKGFHVFVWNRTPRPIPNFVGAPAELAEMCDYLQIFVSDDDALLHVVKQLAPGLAARHIVLAHSTVAPATMTAAAEIVERRGARFLEVPFTGSKEAAEKGELVYYVGGDEAALREARPLLEASGKQVMEIGAVGQATAIKLATNMVTAATIQAAAEALALVQTSGLPLQKFVAAMEGNASNSKTISMKLGKMIEGNFEPHFSVKHMLKDMQIAGRLGLSNHLELGVSTAARDRLIEQMQKGHGDDDYSVVIRKYFPEPGQAAARTENGLDLFAPRPERAPAADPFSAPPPGANAEALHDFTMPIGDAVSVAEAPAAFSAPALAAQELPAPAVASPVHESAVMTAAPEEEPVYVEEPEADEEVEPPRGFLSRLLRR